MRIGFYTPNYPGLTSEGGIGSATRLMGHGLSALGHEVHVLTPGDRASAVDGSVRVHFASSDHFPGVDRLAPGAGACWRIGRAMQRLVHRHRLDIVEFANWEGYGLMFLQAARPPTVVRLSTSSRETQEIDDARKTRWRRWDVHRERWQARAADILVTHSHAHRRLMASEIGVPEARIRLVPYGITVFPEWVRPPPRPGPPLIVYLGRLEHRKGTVELLQAIPRVLQAEPETRFVLIGADRPHCPGGRTHAEYLKQEFAPEVQRQVTLAGRLPQEEVDRWLQTADLFVAPSRYESFGLIFLEAMRWGTPVLGAAAGGVPEIVADGKSGVLVPPGDADAIANAVIALSADPARREALGKEGRRVVEGKFNLRRMSQSIAEMYAELVAARKSRRFGRRATNAN